MTVIKVTNQSEPMIKITTNARLGTLKEDEHNQDHNNKVRPTFDDNHQKENYDGKRSQTHIWVFKQWKSWWIPSAHHHHCLHNTRRKQYYIFFNKKGWTCNKHHWGLKTNPKWTPMEVMMINKFVALTSNCNQWTSMFNHPKSKFQTNKLQ